MDKNYSVYFVLPLLGIKHTIYPIVNSFIQKNGYYVYVLMEEDDEVLKENKYFKCSVIINSGLYYIFTIIDYKDDFNLFRESRYSEMSKEAKLSIVYLSGLPYKKRSDGVVDLHILIHKLYKTPLYKHYINKEVNEYSKYSEDKDVLEDLDEWIEELNEKEFLCLQ